MRLIGTRLMPRKPLKNQRGDTIVEVLIATAIVSMVLTSAYAVTNRNVQIQQTIREQAQAQKLVSQQIESLRVDADIASVVLGGCYIAPMEKASGEACKVAADGGAPSGGAVFKLAIDKDTTSPGTYIVSATWETLGGQESNIRVYYYR